MLQRSSDPPFTPDEAATPAPAKWSQPTVDLREMARILRRRWQLVALPPAGLAGLAFFYLLFLSTTLYTATATVFVDPRRATAIESNQSQGETSNYGTDDATIDSEALLIQSIAIAQRVVEKLKLTEDDEFNPPPTTLVRIKQLFRSGGSEGGASAQDAAVARAVDILQHRMKVARQGTTFLVDINVSSESPRTAAQLANAVADP